MSTFVTIGLIICQLSLTLLPSNSLLKSADKWLADRAHPPIVQSFDQIAAPTFVPIPQKISSSGDAPIQAQAGLVYDIGSAQYLASKDIDSQRSVASLAKILTAIIIMRDHRVDEIMTVPDNLPVDSDVQSIGIHPGEQFRIDQALRALLIYSAGDMAQALAVWDAGSMDKFADKMNTLAGEWGLTNSHFSNSIGLDDTKQYSSARDLTRLSQIALHSPLFTQLVNTKQAEITDTTGKTYRLTNTNELLAQADIFGIKTGTTGGAGETYIALAKRDGHELICVVLHSPDRFQDCKNMLDWAFANYIWK